MRVPFIAAICAASFAASAADSLVFTSETVQVKLHEGPCLVASLGLVLAQNGGQNPRQASVHFDGRDIPACWASLGDKVLVADMDGDAGYISKSDLKPEHGV
jgi:hypothetical protein